MKSNITLIPLKGFLSLILVLTSLYGRSQNTPVVNPWLGRTGYNKKAVALMQGDARVFDRLASIKIEFAYEKVRVGKYPDEKQYLAKKDDDFKRIWYENRKNRFEPIFVDSFCKYANLSYRDDALYTLIFFTTFVEPGYNVGVSRKQAFISGEAKFVETANPNHVVATFALKNVTGRESELKEMTGGFDTGWRIEKAYREAARQLGGYIITTNPSLRTNTPEKFTATQRIDAPVKQQIIATSEATPLPTTPETPSTPTPSHVSFGLKIGLNYANTSFISNNSGNFSSDPIVGFHGGIFLQFRFGKLGLQPEVYYSMQGSRIYDGFSSRESKLNYVNVPVLLRYNPIPILFMEAGPQASLLVSNQPNLNGFDFGLTGGVGVNIPLGFIIGVRYSAGLLNVEKNAAALMTEKNNVWQAYVGFKLTGR